MWINDNSFYLQDYFDEKLYHHAHVNHSKPQKYVCTRADASLVICRALG